MSLKKNVLTVFQGTIAAQAIGFLALPVISRVYDAEALGFYQVYTTVVAFVLVLAFWRYEIALLHAEPGGELRDLICLSSFINFLMAALCLAGCVLLVMCGLQGEIQLGWSIWFVPLVFILSGALHLAGYLNIRFRSFRVQAVSKVAQATTYAVTAIGLGVWSASPSSLVIADLIGRLSGTLISMGYVIRKRQIDSLTRFTYEGLRTVAVRYRNLPQYSLPGSLLNTAGSMLTPILILNAFDASTAGQYGLVERSLSLPLGLISQSVSQVFMGDFSNALRSAPERALSLFQRIVRVQFMAAIIPAVLLMGFSPWAFTLVFGAKWQPAGDLCRIMTPLFVTSFVVGPVGMSLTLLHRVGVQTAWDIARLVAVVALWVSAESLQLSVQFVLAAHVLVNVVAYVVFLVLTHHYLKVEVAERSPSSEPPAS